MPFFVFLVQIWVELSKAREESRPLAEKIPSSPKRAALVLRMRESGYKWVAKYLLPVVTAVFVLCYTIFAFSI